MAAMLEAPVRFVDLFCGIGSFHYSFSKLGWQCVMACDIDKAARATYQANYGMEPLGDITIIPPEGIPPHDVLCAGFPCQPFSQCGKHKGFEDERGTLFFHIMKFVTHHSPKFVLLENVQGLLKHDSGRTLERICRELLNADYAINYKVIKCSDYGIPQMRKRLIIVAIKNGGITAAKILEFGDYKKETTMSEFLGKPFDKATAYTIRCGGKNSPIGDKHNWDGYMVGGNQYRLTKKDCLKLQGFGDDFVLCGTDKEQWKQLGNTIPTIFTEMLGLNIVKYLAVHPLNPQIPV